MIALMLIFPLKAQWIIGDDDDDDDDDDNDTLMMTVLQFENQEKNGNSLNEKILAPHTCELHAIMNIIIVMIITNTMMISKKPSFTKRRIFCEEN